MSRTFVDTPESTSQRSPIMEENDKLHRRNSLMFGLLVYTYFAAVTFAACYGAQHVVKTCF